MKVRLAFFVAVSAVPAISQPRVDSRNLYERIIAVVPLTGAGTYADPRRPLFAPSPSDQSADGIIEFFWQESDDGKSPLSSWSRAITRHFSRSSTPIAPTVGWRSSAEGLTLSQLQQAGHQFVIANNTLLPFGSGSICQVVTNNVPIGQGQSTWLGSMIQPSEIWRILSQTGVWINNGVVVPRP
jgi:hypothetical protein